MQTIKVKCAAIGRAIAKITLCLTVGTGVAQARGSDELVADRAPAAKMTAVLGADAPVVDEASPLATILGVPADEPESAPALRMAALLGADAPLVTVSRTASLGAVLDRRPATGRTAPIFDWAAIDALPPADGDRNWVCMTEALYHEARGETIEGIYAVAEVILNRVDSPRFPDTICGVVNQGCQFSYTCDGHSDAMSETRIRERLEKVAQIMVDGGARTLTNGAQYYHTKAVSPYWSRVFDRTTTIGAHHFYFEA